MSVTLVELTLARKIAYRIGSKWGGVDVEDVTSELILWLYDNEATVDRYREEDGGEGKLYVSLRRAASKYCAKEQAQVNGAPLEDEYSLSVIERAMPFVFEDVPQTTIRVNPYNGAPVDTLYDSGNALALLTDIKSAYVDMPYEVRHVLALRFRDGLSYQEIGDILGITDRGAKARVSRGVFRVHVLVNGLEPA